MGSFGVGNFDNDDALDVRHDFIKQILANIQENMEDANFGVEDCDRVVAYIVILRAILQRTQCSATLPEGGELLSFLKTMGSGIELTEQVIRQWRDIVLKVFDDEIDETQPAPGYKAGRRKAIEEAFFSLESFVGNQDA